MGSKALQYVANIYSVQYNPGNPPLCPSPLAVVGVVPAAADVRNAHVISAAVGLSVAEIHASVAGVPGVSSTAFVSVVVSIPAVVVISA